MVYVGQGPAYVVWSGIPSWVLNRFESSVMETQLTVHHRRLITGTRIRLVMVLDMKFHDLNTDRVSFVYDFMKFSI